MKDDEFSEVLRTVVPPGACTQGWLDGARRKRRRRQAITAGAVGALVLGFAVPLGVALVPNRIVAQPAETPSPVQVCQVDNVLEPAAEVSGAAEFTRGAVCTGTLSGEDPQQHELPSSLLAEVASSVLADSVSQAQGEWTYGDSALVLVTDAGGVTELWQIDSGSGDLAYVWRRGADLLVWVPAPEVAARLGGYLVR